MPDNVEKDGRLSGRDLLSILATTLAPIAMFGAGAYCLARYGLETEGINNYVVAGFGGLIRGAGHSCAYDMDEKLG